MFLEISLLWSVCSRNPGRAKVLDSELNSKFVLWTFLHLKLVGVGLYGFVSVEPYVPGIDGGLKPSIRNKVRNTFFEWLLTFCV